jgi:hypothetical protein
MYCVSFSCREQQLGAKKHRQNSLAHQLKSQLLPLYVSSTLKKAPPLQTEPLQLPMSQLLQLMPLVTIIVLSAAAAAATGQQQLTETLQDTSGFGSAVHVHCRAWDFPAHNPGFTDLSNFK